MSSEFRQLSCPHSTAQIVRHPADGTWNVPTTLGDLMIDDLKVAETSQDSIEKLSKAYRDVQESFSRVTATLAESVAGIRVTQGFVRQKVNAELFHELVADHAQYNITAARTSGVF